MGAGDHITRMVNQRVNRSLFVDLPVESALWAGRLITEAGFQLRVSHLGLDLYRRLIARDLEPSSIGETSQFIELGCENMICRSLMTCLDLCAASIAHVSGLHPIALPDGSTLPLERQADADMFKNNDHLQSAMKDGRVPAPLAIWIRNLRSLNQWRTLKQWRHGITHNWVQHNQTIAAAPPIVNLSRHVGGQPPDSLPDPSRPNLVPAKVVLDEKERDLLELSEEMVRFVSHQFEKFIDALEAAMPST